MDASSDIAGVRALRRRVSPVTTVIASVHLVLLRRERQSYAITTLRELPLT